MNRKVKFFLYLLAFIIVLRVSLPFVLKYQINRVLKSEVSGFTGHVQDVDVSLLTGSYFIDAFVLKKLENKIAAPFIEIDRTRLAIYWKPIFSGKVVGKVYLNGAKLNFAVSADGKDVQSGTEGDGWQSALKKIFPLDIEILKIKNSTLSFQDLSSKPKVDVALRNLSLTATNLRNTQKSNSELISDLNLNANIGEKGSLELKGSFDLLKEPLAFDVNLEIKNINLVYFNEAFKVYAGFDVKKGRLNLSSEAASKESLIKGYVKPVITGMDVIQIDERIDGVSETFSELLVSFINLTVRKYSKDQVALKLPFKGKLSDPEVGVWDAVKSMFSHAFGDALKKGVDSSITIESVDK